MPINIGIIRLLSQEDLAAKIYVSRQTVSNWETDKTYPDVENLLLLSVLFDVTIDELIKGDVEAMKETFFLFYGIGLVAALRAARFYKQQDLATFREILAFSKGEPVNRSNPTSQRVRQHKALKLAIATLTGALVGGFLGYYAYVSLVV